MPKLYFRNPTPLDIRAATILGVNAKESPGAIGQFGTGLKNAIAGILRLGGSIRIWNGEEWYDFSASPFTLRGIEFKQVRMHWWPMNEDAQSQDLGFTTALAKHWEPWMFYRELLSNALDEGGGVGVVGDDALLTPSFGSTLIEVVCEELWMAHAQREEFLLEGEPLWSNESLAVYRPLVSVPGWAGGKPSGTGFLYYHGIRATSDHSDHHWNFRYSLLTEHQLTEDRTLYNLHEVRQEIAKALLVCDNEEIVQAALASGDEQGMDYDCPAVPPGETFLRVALARAKAKTGLSSSARRAIERARPEALASAEELEVGGTWEEIEAGAPEPAPKIEACCYAYIHEANEWIAGLEEELNYWRKVAKALAAKEKLNDLS